LNHQEVRQSKCLKESEADQWCLWPNFNNNNNIATKWTPSWTTPSTCSAAPRRPSRFRIRPRYCRPRPDRGRPIRWTITGSGVNFINIVLAAIKRADPKGKKKTVKLSVFLRFWDLYAQNLCVNMLVKLTPAIRPLLSGFNRLIWRSSSNNNNKWKMNPTTTKSNLSVVTAARLIIRKFDFF